MSFIIIFLNMLKPLRWVTNIRIVTPNQLFWFIITQYLHLCFHGHCVTVVSFPSEYKWHLLTKPLFFAILLIKFTHNLQLWAQWHHSAKPETGVSGDVLCVCVHSKAAANAQWQPESLLHTLRYFLAVLLLFIYRNTKDRISFREMLTVRSHVLHFFLH